MTLRGYRGAVVRQCRFGIFLALATITGLGLPSFDPPAWAQASAENSLETALERPSVIEAIDDEISSLRARINAGQETASSDQLAAQAALDQATDAVARARASEASAAEFLDLAAQAPQRLEATKAELRAPLAELKSHYATLDLSGLETEAKVLETALAGARASMTQLDEELSRRGERRIALAAVLEERRVALDQLRFESGPRGSAAAGTGVAGEALAIAERARTAALHAEIAMFRAELTSYESRRALLTARHDVAAYRSAELQKGAVKLASLIEQKRREQAAAAVEKAKQRRAELAQLAPQLGELVDINTELAIRRTGEDGLASQVTKAQQDRDRAERKLALLDAQYQSVWQKIDAVGYTDAIAALLLKQRAALPSRQYYPSRSKARQPKVSNAQLAILELEERRRAVSKLETAVQRFMTSLRPSVAGADPDEEAAGLSEPAEVEVEHDPRIEIEARGLLSAQRETIDALIRDYDSYFAALVELDATERALGERVEHYRDLVGEHILWIRSARAIPLTPPSEFVAAVLGIINPTPWATAVGAAWAVVQSTPITTILYLLVTLGLLGYRRRGRALLAQVVRSREISDFNEILRSINALVLTIFVASPLPFIAFALSQPFLTLPAALDPLSFAIGTALREMIGPLFLWESVRALTEPNGIARRLLGFPDRGLALVRTKAIRVELISLPCLAVARILEASGQAAASNTLGRTVFIASAVILANALYRILDHNKPFAAAIAARTSSRALKALMPYAHTLALAIMVGLIAAAASGYYYTALTLSHRLTWSAAALLSLGLINALALRWVATASGRLAAQQLEERRAETGTVPSITTEDAEDPVAKAKPDKLRMAAVNEQIRQLARVTFSLSFILVLWRIWGDTLPALRIFDRVELWTISAPVTEAAMDSSGMPSAGLDTVAITLGDLLSASLMLALTVFSARNLPAFLNLAILQKLRLEPGVAYAISTIARYAIGTAGTIITFDSLGAAWSHVQWLVAAMTVGLGFGLQEIFANFVSGLIMLFERPVRVGDTVTIGSLSGRVTRIRMRATTIIDWDRKELIVPNKEFITGQLVNWTLSSPVLRLTLPVGVAYGSDTAAVEKVLRDAAAENTNVLRNPEPQVVFQSFGESSLDFELRVFIDDIDRMIPTRHVLNLAIDRLCREAGIEISFPQRDLHLRSITEPIPVRMSPQRS